MPVDPPDEMALAARLNALFPGLPGDCGNEAEPGTDESPRNRDWTRRSTTKDQTRIEQFLVAKLTPASRILHIGIGNSSLATRFCGHNRRVCGLTISLAELEHAKSLHLPGYHVYLCNKYGMDFQAIQGPFDVLIDNNPTTFACCTRHFSRMLLGYRAKLAPGGIMIADRAGLAHLASDDPALARWCFSPADWATIGEIMGMMVAAQGEHVLTMQQTALQRAQ